MAKKTISKDYIPQFITSMWSDDGRTVKYISKEDGSRHASDIPDIFSEEFILDCDGPGNIVFDENVLKGMDEIVRGNAEEFIDHRLGIAFYAVSQYYLYHLSPGAIKLYSENHMDRVRQFRTLEDLMSFTDEINNRKRKFSERLTSEYMSVMCGAYLWDLDCVLLASPSSSSFVLGDFSFLSLNFSTCADDMKKTLLLISTLLILLMITSCDPEAKHVHSWGEWTTSKEATCTETGLQIRKCTSCEAQDEETQVIKALGHVLRETVTKEATCGVVGEETYSCTRENCDYKGTKAIPASGKHQYSWKQNETKDKHYKECSVCKDKTTESDHNYGEWFTDTDSTEETEGKKHRICSTCSFNEEETIPLKAHTHTESTSYGYDETSHWKKCTKTTCSEKLDSTDHTITETVNKNATCLEKGSKTIKCQTCGYEKTEEIPKTDHTYSTEGEVTKEASCTSAGVKTFRCTTEGCTATITGTIPATGHTYGEEKTEVASCQKEGETYKLCTVCGDKYVISSTPKLNEHAWDNGTVTTPATCTTTGEKTFTCTTEGCTATKTETIPATGHTEREKKTEEPTCTKAGRTYKICSVCNQEYDITTIDALGHNWGDDWGTKTAGTCKTKAELTRSCGRCNTTETMEGEYGTHPTDKLVWKSGDTISFLTKTEKKEYCTECGKATGNIKKDYDSIEGYWLSNDSTKTDNDIDYKSYFSIDMDKTGNALIENVVTESDGKIKDIDCIEYTYTLGFDESNPTVSIGFML